MGQFVLRFKTDNADAHDIQKTILLTPAEEATVDGMSLCEISIDGQSFRHDNNTLLEDGAPDA